MHGMIPASGVVEWTSRVAIIERIEATVVGASLVTQLVPRRSRWRLGFQGNHVRGSDDCIMGPLGFGRLWLFEDVHLGCFVRRENSVATGFIRTQRFVRGRF